MMKTLLLICALHAAGGLLDETAEAVVPGPDAISPGQCGLPGQAYIAHDAIVEYLDGAH
jgi:hypothetical protein